MSKPQTPPRKPTARETAILSLRLGAQYLSPATEARIWRAYRALVSEGKAVEEKHASGASTFRGAP